MWFYICVNKMGVLNEKRCKNKYYWLNELQINIEKITDECRVQNIYMCKKDDYKDFDIIS